LIKFNLILLIYKYIIIYNSVPLVNRLLGVLNQDATRFKTILTNYTAPLKLGNNLHAQALDYAKFDGDDPQEICVLFVIERIMVEIGFIEEGDVPTKAVDYKDPWVKKYTYHDFIIVLTLLTLGLVQGKLLKKPDILRRPQGKKTRIVYTEEDMARNKEEREDAEDLVVGVKELRSMYAFLEERVLLDLESFHVGLRQQPNDMIILSESRMETFGLWNEAQKNRIANLREDEDENENENEEEKEARRKRVRGFMMGDDDEDD